MHLVTAIGEGFDCEFARPEDAPQRMLNAPSLVVIDLPIVDDGSLAFCETLREMFSTPVVICSISSKEWDIVRAFEAGADDYLPLPMSLVELRARLRATLRRCGEQASEHATSGEIVAGDLRLSLDERRVYRRGHPIDLSPIEYRLLLSLMRESGRPVSHSKLLFSVWGPEYVDSRHYLRLYIRYLRSKVEDNPAKPELILNEWGTGYRFQAKPQAPSGPPSRGGRSLARSVRRRTSPSKRIAERILPTT